MTRMTWKAIGPLAAALSLSAVVSLGGQARQDPPVTPAAQPAESHSGEITAFAGSDLYRSYCAVCHGTSARGDGPLADRLKKRPPDLTQFALQNGGVFPAAMVAKIIDGRSAVPGHGGPDMPVWGDTFKESRVGGSEATVKARIDELVKYLASLQARAGE